MIFDVTLERMYKKLKTLTERNALKGKPIEKSLLTVLLKMNSTNRFSILKASSIPSIDIEKENISILCDKNLIRTTDVINQYILTAKGIYEIEKSINKINEQELLDFIDKNYFSIFKETEKDLKDNEKIILLAMVATRTFSEDSCMNLNMDESNMAINTWKEIFEMSFNILKELNLISKIDLESFYGKIGNDDPITHVMERMNDLPKKTKGLYKPIGDRKYCIKLPEDKKEFGEDLKFLFKKILGDKKLSNENIEKLNNFCIKIAREKEVHIFDPKKHKFHFEYDKIIREALLFSNI